jgi:hypothetical protein
MLFERLQRLRLAATRRQDLVLIYFAPSLHAWLRRRRATTYGWRASCPAGSAPEERTGSEDWFGILVIALGDETASCSSPLLLFCWDSHGKGRTDRSTYGYTNGNIFYRHADCRSCPNSQC